MTGIKRAGEYEGYRSGNIKGIAVEDEWKRSGTDVKQARELEEDSSALCEICHILGNFFNFWMVVFIDLLCRRGLFEPLWRSLTINSKVFLEI